MLNSKVLKEITQIVGKENVFTAPEDLHCYAEDATLGVISKPPEAVVKPGSAEEISRILKLANKEHFPVVPRGAGTSLSGGAMPLEGGIVLETNRLNKILEIDKENLTAFVQPGVITAKFHQEVEKLGLFFPPDPGSMAVSTLGGNVASSSGGLRGLKYGTTRDYVLGLQVVMPWGAIVNIGGRTAKNVTGYDLTRLMVGSEGTLGVITEITVKLLPLPSHSRSMLAIFDQLDNAAETISAIIANKIIPCTLDIMDNNAIKAIEAASKVGLPLEAEAILLIEVDGSIEAVVEDELQRVQEICQEYKVREVQVARTPEEKIKVWQARRNSYGAFNKLNNTDIVEDVTVPRSKVPDMIRVIRDLAERYDLTIATLGHAGDGNMHPNIVYDRNNKDEVEQVEKAVDDMFAAAIKMGGTLSGEHGIGLTKKPFMKWEMGDDGIEVLARIKNALDPNGILNPGKMY